ncbi:MAG TPA: M23 family metallopeptidase [Gemmatimonadaceae bacterium]|nr:M23 family metallopeptidase [Gemmatimonadaceae bacterium]
MRSVCRVAVAFLAAAAPSWAEGQAQLPPFVELRVTKPPTVVSGNGVSFLVHELHVTNFQAAPLTLARVEVLGADAGAPVLFALEDSTLARALARPGLAPAPVGVERLRLGGGLRGVAFLWVPVDARTPPRRVRHRVTVSLGSGDSLRTHTIEGAVVGVAHDVAVLGPPLRGDGWLAVNGPDPQTGHRRALVPVDGNAAIAQRFGIDYVKMDSSGRRFVGDSLRNESYYAQGTDAIAVADGIVVSVKDGIPENVPGPASRAVPITLETVGGNFVILDIGQGRFAFYAHLQPGSLRVRPGDRVRKGQVVGLVGNSGNSTEPHLHFHLMDGTSPLGSEGIPYVHESFELLGRCGRVFADCKRSTPETRRREMPMANMVIAFPK